MKARHPICFVALFCALLACAANAADLVEFLSGAKARGTVKEIRKADKEFDLEVQLGQRKLVRTYTFDQVHAVTIKGKRYVLNRPVRVGEGSGDARSGALRTRDQVLDLIDSVGRTPPDWYDSTKLDYPKTLDLGWPLKPPTKGWNNKKNVGQYKWDIINPNPGRWRSVVRLIHKTMSLHKDQPALLRRDMKTLGEMYFELFQDYPRAAFWLRQAKVRLPEPQSIHLAECYWRLGNKQMVLQVLNARKLPTNAIKLLGVIGQPDRAGKLAEAFGRGYPDLAREPYLLAGDAYRLAERHQRVVEFYEKVLVLGQARNENYQKIYAGRARESIAAIRLFDKANVSKVSDGSYRASSTGYNGAVQVEVKVAAGKIEAVRVTKHREKQFYAALTDTPNQILKKQSVKQIDATSRATITSQAIVNATAQALAKGS